MKKLIGWKNNAARLAPFGRRGKQNYLNINGSLMMTVFDDFKQILVLSFAERREEKTLEPKQFDLRPFGGGF